MRLRSGEKAPKQEVPPGKDSGKDGKDSSSAKPSSTGSSGNKKGTKPPLKDQPFGFPSNEDGPALFVVAVFGTAAALMLFADDGSREISFRDFRGLMEAGQVSREYRLDCS